LTISQFLVVCRRQGLIAPKSQFVGNAQATMDKKLTAMVCIAGNCLQTLELFAFWMSW
jgi:hypothetical protein